MPRAWPSVLTLLANAGPMSIDTILNAVVDGTPGGAFTLLIVDPKPNPGVEVTAAWDAMGMRGGPTTAR